MKRIANTSKSDQAWLDHCKAQRQSHDAKAAELVAEGWRKSGPKRQPRFTRNGETVELRRQMGSPKWYAVNV